MNEETNLNNFKKLLKKSYTINYITKLKIIWMMIFRNVIPDSKQTPNSNLD